MELAEESFCDKPMSLFDIKTKHQTIEVVVANDDKRKINVKKILE